MRTRGMPGAARRLIREQLDAVGVDALLTMTAPEVEALPCDGGALGVARARQAIQGAVGAAWRRSRDTGAPMPERLEFGEGARVVEWLDAHGEDHPGGAMALVHATGVGLVLARAARHALYGAEWWRDRGAASPGRVTGEPAAKEAPAAERVDLPDGTTEVALVGSEAPTVEEVMEAFGLDPAEWHIFGEATPIVWTTTMRDAEGELVQARNWRLKVRLRRDPWADVPDLSSRAPLRIMPPTRPRDGEVERWLVLPDWQVGYRWADRLSYLVPMHDRWALDCAVQLVSREHEAGGLTGVIVLGDDLDHPTISRFAVDPSTMQTLAPAVAECGWWYEQIRRAAPSSRIVRVVGNHDERPARTVARQAPHLAELLGDLTEQIHARMGLEALDVELGARRHGERVRLADGLLVATHGDYTGPDAARKQRERMGDALVVVHGHTHQGGVVQRTIDTTRGPRVQWAGSPGCLCRLDEHGPPPGHHHPDWQQGVWLVAIQPGAGRASVTTYGIDRGVMLGAPGGAIVARDVAAEVAEATGWAQLVRRAG